VHIIVVVVWCSSKLGQCACWLHGYGTVRAVLLYCCIVYMYKQRCLLYLLSFCVGCVDWPVVSAALLHWLTQCCVLHLLFFSGALLFGRLCGEASGLLLCCCSGLTGCSNTAYAALCAASKI
jgi:hypothetical protein